MHQLFLIENKENKTILNFDINFLKNLTNDNIFLNFY